MKPRVIIAGASGLVGTALSRALAAEGYAVARLVRRAPRDAGEIPWDPAAGELAPERLDGAVAIINLAGENVGAGRWTAARRERILRSRVEATRTLVVALNRLARKPEVFLSASAVGFYGDRGDEVLTESSAIGIGFLPEVCLAWETHAEGAERGGVRTVLLRFGVVLDPAGGALARMLPLFRLGLGGRLGSGRQWMSWIDHADATRAIVHALRDTRCRGPVNLVAPEPVTNREFTRALGRALRRPAVLPAPAWALRLALGSMADEALLASARAQPERLQSLGFAFRSPRLADALRGLAGG